MNKESVTSAVQALEFGWNTLTDTEKASIPDKKPVPVLQNYLGLRNEYDTMTLVNEYYKQDYAQLLAEFDVALIGIDQTSPKATWDVIEQIAKEMASHPLVLKHTPNLEFNLKTREWEKNAYYYKVVNMNKDLYMQKAYVK